MQRQIREGENPRTLTAKLNKFRQQHPVASAAATAGAVCTGAVVLAPALLVGGLNVVGFTAGGTAAGSLAAAAQSAFFGGAVQAGSAFALAQSAAMGGIAVAPVGAQIAAGTAAAAGGWFGFGKKAEPLPSRSWVDGDNFVPSPALLDSVLSIEKYGDISCASESDFDSDSGDDPKPNPIDSQQSREEIHTRLRALIPTKVTTVDNSRSEMCSCMVCSRNSKS